MHIGGLVQDTDHPEGIRSIPRGTARPNRNLKSGEKAENHMHSASAVGLGVGLGNGGILKPCIGHTNAYQDLDSISDVHKQHS